MLIQQLRELEADGLIRREAKPVVPHTWNIALVLWEKASSRCSKECPTGGWSIPQNSLIFIRRYNKRCN
jgi:hypothetical protein